ncbi:uncharacterized protein LODBEIA_P59140 [Lodderomyces beijingensis]|uniref:Palmitoyltransferase n=1 Tax=Lodderomyces beijingensis TaxID=1775926 RepID=A0ABP0ZVY9_9ASCO
MVAQFQWPILGVVIPVALISVVAYGSHFFILRHHLSAQEQIGYECMVSMIWVSYALAIFKEPGRPPKKYEPRAGEWRRFCKKCQGFRPPRTHHCSQCQQCVLEMDHHCPWTMNCVGHENFPHFMRFLSWILIGCTYLLVQLCSRIMEYYNMSEMPIYLVDKVELSAVIVFTLADLFVLLTIGLLFIRCVWNMGKGMTQIETWEWEQLESQFRQRRLWSQIRENYEKLHKSKLPPLSTWTNASSQQQADEDGMVETHELMQLDSQQEEEEEDASTGNFQNTKRRSRSNSEQVEVPSNFTIDDVIFPYDYGCWGNFTSALGPVYSWMIPCCGPKGNGYDISASKEFEEFDQLGLPWPPNFVYQDIGVRDSNYITKREWRNDMGESLTDYGVDMEAED